MECPISIVPHQEEYMNESLPCFDVIKASHRILIILKREQWNHLKEGKKYAWDFAKDH
jgi:hypothetical protein